MRFAAAGERTGLRVLSMDRLVRALVRNIQNRATCLAMYRVAIVALKTADGAWESHLGGSQQRLGKTQEKSHAEDHNDNRDQATKRSWQSDVAKTRRGQRRHCKVERIGIVDDVIIVGSLSLVDNSGHYENENRKICHGKDYIFISPKEGAVDPKPGDHLVIAQQSQCSKSTQETGSFSGERRKK